MIYVHSKHFFAKLMLHPSSIINKIVINIMIIEVMYKAKLPHSFVDSRCVTSSPEFAAWIPIQSQSSTADDLQGLHRNNRRFGVSLLSKLWTKHSRAQLDVIGRMPVATRRWFEIGGVRPKSAQATLIGQHLTPDKEAVVLTVQYTNNIHMYQKQ